MPEITITIDVNDQVASRVGLSGTQSAGVVRVRQIAAAYMQCMDAIISTSAPFDAAQRQAAAALNHIELALRHGVEAQEALERQPPVEDPPMQSTAPPAPVIPPQEPVSDPPPPIPMP